MQAQERKCLVNKLINLKKAVDDSKPKQYHHLSLGRFYRRNDEVKRINEQNKMTLGKILKIMNRKP